MKQNRLDIFKETMKHDFSISKLRGLECGQPICLELDYIDRPEWGYASRRENIFKVNVWKKGIFFFISATILRRNTNMTIVGTEFFGELGREVHAPYLLLPAEISIGIKAMTTFTSLGRTGSMMLP
jgi:hypothetical protein